MLPLTSERGAPIELFSVRVFHSVRWQANGHPIKSSLSNNANPMRIASENTKWSDITRIIAGIRYKESILAENECISPFSLNQ